MSQKITKDERVLLKIYEMSNESTPITQTFLASHFSLTKRTLENIINLLTSMNFTKKKEDEVFITPHGKSLAKRLQQDLEK